MNEQTKEKDRERSQRYRAANKDASRRWQLANPDKVRNAHYLRTYGITLPEFLDMERNQKGVCAICKRDAARCVDHNHKTGKIRALLCRKCNSGLGQFREDFSVLIRAADYVRRHNGLTLAKE